MNLAIIGAGKVGTALGKGLADAGHHIVYGLRDPGSSKYDELKHYKNSSTATIEQACSTSDIIFLTLPWPEAEKTIKSCGSLKGKIIVDCMNPLKAGTFELEFNADNSAAEQIQKWASDAKVVKSFNHCTFLTMQNPQFGSQKAAIFAAGDDADATKKVADLARDLGFDAFELPELKAARQLEQLAYLWITTAYKYGKGPHFAYAIVER